MVLFDYTVDYTMVMMPMHDLRLVFRGLSSCDD